MIARLTGGQVLGAASCLTGPMQAAAISVAYSLLNGPAFSSSPLADRTLGVSEVTRASDLICGDP